MKNKDSGLSEAVAACTSYLVFSEKPFRLCNLKSARTVFGRLYSWSRTEKEESFFFKNKIYQKGRLSLLDILPDDYKKLSAEAQKYFSAWLEKASANGRGVFVYRPNIPKSYLKEREEKLYWNFLSVPNSAAESESKKIENWLDRGKECELWHYEGYRGWHHFWRRDKSTKQERAERKAEIRQIIGEFFSESSKILDSETSSE